MNHNQFDKEPFGLSWQHQLSDGLMQHQIKIIPTSTENEFESVECLRLRTICHVLLDYLSDEGLAEIKESLIEAINFYHEPEVFSESYEMGESLEVSIGEGYERPVFQIEED